MRFFNEMPPTAGFRLKWAELFPSGGNGNELEEDFRRLLGLPYARITSSGTAALFLILHGLKMTSPKRTVVIPSFVCPLIPLAIHRAGLTTEVCDIRRDSFDFDTANLRKICETNPDVLAVVAVHLAGIPVDMDAVVTATKNKGIIVIEDCAQSMGALYEGRQVGTLGDVSFFSLCRGKGVTTYEGGAIAFSNGKYAGPIDGAIKEHTRNDLMYETSMRMLLAGYWIFYRPSLFWPVFKLPQKYWTWRGNMVKAADEDFGLDFPVHKMSLKRQGIGHRQFPRLEEEIRQQRSKAEFYFRGLRGIEGISVIKEDTGSAATYPFVAVVFDDAELRNNALRALDRTGTGASFVYALAICDYDYLDRIVPSKNCDNGRFMAGHCMTLSTNSFISKKDMETAISILRDVLAR